MKELIDTLVAFVVCVAAWRCWKKTARAVVRDRLFDLRDELREHYARNGLDMGDGAYAKMRGLLNSLLRYTKDMRMVGYLYFSTHVDPETVKAVSKDFDDALGYCDPATAALVKKIRRQASEAIFLYMAATSLGFISAVVIMALSMLPARMAVAIRKCARTLFEFQPATLECAAMR